MSRDILTLSISSELYSGLGSNTNIHELTIPAAMFFIFFVKIGEPIVHV
jgi:hypothetical protein